MAGEIFSQLKSIDFKGGLKNPNVSSAIGAASDAIGGFLPQKEVYSGPKGGITNGMDAVYDKVSDYISAVPVWGQAASVLMKANGVVSKGVAALGAGTSGMTTQDAILGSNFFQMTPLGLVNGFGGKRSHTLENGLSEQDTISNAGSGYGGFVQGWLDTQKYSNKKYGLLSSGARKKANSRIDKYNNNMNTLTYISNTARDRMEMTNNMADQNYLNYNMQLQGGYNPRTTVGKNGMKLEYIKKAQQVARSIKKFGGKIEESYFIPEDWNPSDPQKFQNGGSVNVIPTGALHARLHHMEDSEGLTKKGIPVVDNEGAQQAEIEKDEIIFRKEVTDKIEQLCKEGSDKAAIECGKLLTEEIINNTDDKSGLVPKLLQKNQTGGMLPMQDPKEFIKQNPIKPKSPLDATLNKVPKQKIGADTWIQARIDTAKAGISAYKEQNAINKNAEQDRQQQIQQVLNQPMNGNEQLFDGLALGQKGFKVPETYEQLKEYLTKTDRMSDDYDYEAAFNDPEEYKMWISEETKNPGKGYWSDKYKKPNHITFSIESIYSDPDKVTGGRWITQEGKEYFITSPYLESKHRLDEYLNYFSKYEPNVGLIYNNKTYEK